jgi:hypothetical protein
MGSNYQSGIHSVMEANHMSTIGRRNERPDLEIEQVRRALGVVAVAEPAVFWIYMTQDRQWHVRREGAPGEQAFVSRDAARTFIEVAVARCRSYRLFIEDERGGFAALSAGWPTALRRSFTADEATSIDTD